MAENPTSTGIGQGSAQVFDFSPIAKASADLAATKIGIQKDKKKKEDDRELAFQKTLAGLDAAKVFSKHIPWFQDKIKEIQTYTAQNYNKLREGDPAVKAKFDNLTNEFAQNALYSQGTKEEYRDNDNLRQTLGDEATEGVSDMDSWLTNKAYDSKTKSIDFIVPRLSKREVYKDDEIVKAISGTVGDITTGGSKIVTLPNGDKYEAGTESKFSRIEDFLAGADAMIKGSPSRAKHMIGIWDAVGEKEKENLLSKYGVNNAATYYAYRGWKDHDVVDKKTQSGYSRAPKDDGENDFQVTTPSNEVFNLNLYAASDKNPSGENAPNRLKTFNGSNSVVFKKPVKLNVVVPSTAIDGRTNRPILTGGSLEVDFGQVVDVPTYKDKTKGNASGDNMRGRIVAKDVEDRDRSMGYVENKRVVAGTYTKGTGESKTKETIFIPYEDIEYALPSELKENLSVVYGSPKRSNNTPQKTNSPSKTDFSKRIIKR